MTGLALFGFVVCLALFAVLAIITVLCLIESSDGEDYLVSIFVALVAAIALWGALQIKASDEERRRVKFYDGPPTLEAPIEIQAPGVRIRAPRVATNMAGYTVQRSRVRRPQLPPIDRYINPLHFHRRFDDNDPRPVYQYRYEYVPPVYINPYFNPYERPENRVTPFRTTAFEVETRDDGSHVVPGEVPLKPITGVDYSKFSKDKHTGEPVLTPGTHALSSHEYIVYLNRHGAWLRAENERLLGEVKALAGDCLHVDGLRQVAERELAAKTSALQHASKLIKEQRAYINLLKRRGTTCH